MNRREFLRVVAAAAMTPLAADLDLERLLWVPRTVITVPAMPGFHTLTLDAINETTLRVLRPGLVEMFFRGGPLLTQLSLQGGVWHPWK